MAIAGTDGSDTGTQSVERRLSLPHRFQKNGAEFRAVFLKPVR